MIHRFNYYGPFWNLDISKIYGLFCSWPFLIYEWAVLDIHVGRFRPGCGLFLPFAWVVLLHRPFWYRPLSLFCSAVRT